MPMIALLAGFMFLGVGCLDWLEGPSMGSDDASHSIEPDTPLIEKYEHKRTWDIQVAADDQIYLLEEFYKDGFSTFFEISSNRDGLWRKIRNPGEGFEYSPLGMSVSQADELCILTGRGRLYRLRDGLWEPLEAPLYVHWLEHDPVGNLYAMNQQQFFRLSGGSWVDVGSAASIGQQLEFRHFALDEAGNPAIIARDFSENIDCLLICDGGNWTRVDLDVEFAGDVKVQGGEPGHFYIYDMEAENLLHCHDGTIEDLLPDIPNGNYIRVSTWFAEDGLILILEDRDYYGSRLTCCRLSSEGWEWGLNLVPEDVFAGFRANGKTYVAAEGGLVYSGSTSAWARVRRKLSSDLVSVATFDGEWWCGGRDGLLLHLDRDTGEWIDVGPLETDFMIGDLLIDDQGVLLCLNGDWHGNEIGFWRGDHWEMEEIPFDSFHYWRHIWLDGNGEIWVIGDLGMMAHRGSEGWEEREIDYIFTPRDAFWQDGRHVIVGGRGAVFNDYGSGWIHTQLPCRSLLTGADISTDGTLYVIGVPGILWCDLFGGRYVHVDETIDPTDIKCSITGELWISTMGGEMIYWDGNSSLPALLDYSRRPLYEIAVDEWGRMRVVGGNGIIMASSPVP
ncbi:MAG: hypothetical protein GY835_21150 [bacterium]|nr:hypothetical protein [bacterium]